MATIRRCYITWNGLTGLPGLSVFYAPSGVDPTGDLATFFSTIKANFPTGLTWQIPNGGDELDDTNGVLTGGWAGTPSTVSATGSATSWAAGVGAYVNWNTTAVVNGRRVRGRTFLCPLVASAYDNSGTILAAALSTFQTAATALTAGGKTVIWHRPGSVSGGPGSSAAINAAVVPDQVTSLRTRRR